VWAGLGQWCSDQNDENDDDDEDEDNEDDETNVMEKEKMS
jgi:hypothetical protein